MKILLEDNWTYDGEADDIIEYSKINNIECIILNKNELLQLDSCYFLENIYFCNTEIVQYHLKNTNRGDLIPDTYDKRFHDLYHRTIEKMSILEFKNKYNGITNKFIKPCGNDKYFDGRLINNLTDFELYGVDIPEDNLMIYCCEPMDIIAEVRLLVGNHKIYGYGHMSITIIDNFYQDELFIKKLFECIENDYLCVDIGYIYDKTNNIFRWVVIEINPPFSLDDYDISFNQYINFCIDVCKYINQKIK